MRGLSHIEKRGTMSGTSPSRTAIFEILPDWLESYESMGSLLHLLARSLQAQARGGGRTKTRVSLRTLSRLLMRASKSSKSLSRSGGRLRIQLDDLGSFVLRSDSPLWFSTPVTSAIPIEKGRVCGEGSISQIKPLYLRLAKGQDSLTNGIPKLVASRRKPRRTARRPRKASR